jgi:hypothetical protein
VIHSCGPRRSLSHRWCVPAVSIQKGFIVPGSSRMVFEGPEGNKVNKSLRRLLAQWCASSDVACRACLCTRQASSVPVIVSVCAQGPLLYRRGAYSQSHTCKPRHVWGACVQVMYICCVQTCCIVQCSQVLADVSDISTFSARQWASACSSVQVGVGLDEDHMVPLCSGHDSPGGWSSSHSSACAFESDGLSWHLRLMDCPAPVVLAFASAVVTHVKVWYDFLHCALQPPAGWLSTCAAGRLRVVKVRAAGLAGHYSRWC